MKPLRSATGKIVRVEPVDGPRRLKEVIRGQIRYYESAPAALRAWSSVWTDVTRSDLADAPATIVTEPRETQKGWYLHGVIHPARLHWRRPLEDNGLFVEVGEKGPHWHRLTPKTHEELMADLTKLNRGRVWM